MKHVQAFEVSLEFL